MRNLFLFLLAMLIAVIGIGIDFGAVAKDAKPAPAAMMSKHSTKGVACKDCHVNPSKPQAVTMEKCLTCHEPKALAQKTANTKPTNPHLSRHFGLEADCNSCHMQHKPSVSLCADCHPNFKFKVP